MLDQKQYCFITLILATADGVSVCLKEIKKNTTPVRQPVSKINTAAAEGLLFKCSHHQVPTLPDTEPVKGMALPGEKELRFYLNWH